MGKSILWNLREVEKRLLVLADTEMIAQDALDELLPVISYLEKHRKSLDDFLESLHDES